MARETNEATRSSFLICKINMKIGFITNDLTFQYINRINGWVATKNKYGGGWVLVNLEIGVELNGSLIDF